MCNVNMYECKTNLSKYVSMIVNGTEKEIIICNKGVPVCRITPLEEEQKIIFGTALKYNPDCGKDDPFVGDDSICNLFEESGLC